MRGPAAGDAAQGVQAQTLANAYLAVDAGLEVIPAINKIDLVAADPDRVAAEISNVIGGSPDDIVRISAKTGEGVEELLERLVEQVPAPAGDPDGPLRRSSSTRTTTPTGASSVTSVLSMAGFAPDSG